MNVRFKKLTHHAIVPTRATDGAAGFDLYVPRETHISGPTHRLRKDSNRIIVATGLAIEIPRGFVGFICPRSGLAAKHGVSIANSPGVIDSDYRGEIKVIIVNHGEDFISFTPGTRIAQLLFIPVYSHEVTFEEVQDLGSSERGEGGFGSTGT
jgi:dUTP pyrophosphatase